MNKEDEEENKQRDKRKTDYINGKTIKKYKYKNRLCL